jgi:peptidoglycan hydrolase-like protein with peptidoglycan-binding domain
MMLGELGYDTKNPDGIIGPKTRRAITRFQRGNSIHVDAKVGPQLMAKLRKKRDAIRAKREKARLRELYE